MSDAVTDACVVLVTSPTEAVAAQLARTLVEERLAACGNIVPGLRSIYRWEGAVQDEAEVLLLLKTMRRHVPALTSRVVELHPYAVPEVIVLSVAAGLEAYVGWIAASTSRAQEKQQ